MSTELAPCNPKIYQKGVSLGYFGTFYCGGAEGFEALVEEVRQRSGCAVDWHYMAGWAVLKTMPKDVETVLPIALEVIGTKGLQGKWMENDYVQGWLGAAEPEPM